MEINENLLKDLKNMDKKKLSSLLETAQKSMGKDSDKIMDILKDKEKVEKLKNSISKQDIENVKKSLKSKEDLQKLIQSSDIQQRLKKILGE